MTGRLVRSEVNSMEWPLLAETQSPREGSWSLTWGPALLGRSQTGLPECESHTPRTARGSSSQEASHRCCSAEGLEGLHLLL